MSQDSRLAKIESDVREFVRASYPAMIVRAEYWAQDTSRIALFFVDERFRGLYPRQRYHYLIHLIPNDYYDAFLTNTVWFELTPGAEMRITCTSQAERFWQARQAGQSSSSDKKGESSYGFRATEAYFLRHTLGIFEAFGEWRFYPGYFPVI